eukprot:m.359292 g.359292  ORF g.359292 m.359292 type:complete len:178 (+) comp18511_c0_seq1:61-594(+)
MAEDSWVVVGVALFCTLLGEGISYLAVYRTEKYRQAKSDIEAAVRRVEKQRDEDQLQSKKQKRLERSEEHLKTIHQNFTMIKMRSTMLMSVTFIALLAMFNSVFEGRVVAKLPFQPFSLIQGMTHRGLLGDDATDCSFMFLYALITMAVRQNLQKWLGFGLSRAASKVSSVPGMPTQ